MTNSLKQLLVHLDATRALPHRLVAARQLTQAFGATLSALYAVRAGYLELPPLAGDPSVPVLLAELDEDRRLSARMMFGMAMSGPGPMASWSETTEEPLIPAVAQQAFYADLLVLGQRDPADPGSAGVPPDFVESLIEASGRPAIVVPHMGCPASIGRTIAIAWKQTPEAARAMAAAMPLLQRAEHVHVLTWGPDDKRAVSGRRLDLDGYLRLHGVNASLHHGGPEPAHIGEVILSTATDLGADLLVMGCYGHARAREWVLGGASRTLLREMTIPVLMAR